MVRTAGLFMMAAVTLRAATIIEITTNVLVRDCPRLGMNLVYNNYWDAHVTKLRGAANFEGILYRQCHLGNLYADGFGSVQMTPDLAASRGWERVLSGGTYRVLGGPFHNVTGTIVAVTNRYMRTWSDAQSNVQSFFVLDRPFAITGAINLIGLLVENTSATNGCLLLPYGGGWWTTTNCFLHQGDISPHAWGHTALRMNATSAEAYMRLPGGAQELFENNGAWRYTFRAKALSGAPMLRLAMDFATSRTVTVMPATVWADYAATVTVSGVSGTTRTYVQLRVNHGEALVDDLAVERLDQTNTTAFLDDLVAMLARLRPGMLRLHQEGGSTVSNCIVPVMRAASFMSSPWNSCDPYTAPASTHSFSLHDLYTLCELVDAEPWFCLPGTLHPDEMNQYMEYLGGPTNAGMGMLRAALGHPEPWTKTLRRIHVEFGNEAWNSFGPYLAGGFNRADYWSNLIAIAKASPYYTNTILLQTAGQNFMTYMADYVIGYATNCDRYAIAPYIINSLSTNDLALNDTDEKLFRWAFAYPLMIVHSNGMPQQMAMGAKWGKEYSVYEVNYHTTTGAAPPAPRNKIIASIGGGVSIVNMMLSLMKHCGIRNQCFYSLMQKDYNYGSGNMVKLWGSVLNAKAGAERYRPCAQAMMAANAVMGGDLVATVHTGDDPRFAATGWFYNYARTQSVLFPVLHSYAFRDRIRRGLVIVNLDVLSNQTVTLRLPDGVAGATATQWLLSAPSLTNNNEFESGAPQVTLEQQTVNGFTNGVTIVVPPHALLSATWLVPEPACALAVVLTGVWCRRSRSAPTRAMPE